MSTGDVLKLCRYQKKGLSTKVVVNTHIGRDEEVRIEMTNSRFGQDPGKISKELTKELETKIELKYKI